jgi:hypothetical protein
MTPPLDARVMRAHRRVVQVALLGVAGTDAANFDDDGRWLTANRQRRRSSGGQATKTQKSLGRTFATDQVMTATRFLTSSTRWLGGSAALAGLTYAGYAAVAWWRYGQHPEPNIEARDSLLDGFMPRYDVVERHSIEIAAPADVVIRAAREMDIRDAPLADAIFKAREIVMGAEPHSPPAVRGLVGETISLGWRILAEVPGREIVVGAVTKPWEGNVKFIGLAPDQFAAFTEPNFVKIAWTLRADPIAPTRSMFRTETRAVATDAVARSKFRRYWALASPGIWLIRRLSLAPLKKDAERRFGQSNAA